MSVDGTSTAYISMCTCKYLQAQRHSLDTNKHMYNISKFYHQLGKIHYMVSVVKVLLRET